jgi:hypothetical protein
VLGSIRAVVHDGPKIDTSQCAAVADDRHAPDDGLDRPTSRVLLARKPRLECGAA